MSHSRAARPCRTLYELSIYLHGLYAHVQSRANAPSRLESLLPQTYRDFEWLIVDDGSSDDTKQLVESWQAESKFPIRYIHQQNQGKHTAFNRGVQQAQGELFLTVDSDDAFVPNSLERFLYHWNSIDPGC